MGVSLYEQLAIMQPTLGNAIIHTKLEDGKPNDRLLLADVSMGVMIVDMEHQLYHLKVSDGELSDLPLAVILERAAERFVAWTRFYSPRGAILAFDVTGNKPKMKLREQKKRARSNSKRTVGERGRPVRLAPELALECPLRYQFEGDTSALKPRQMYQLILSGPSNLKECLRNYFATCVLRSLEDACADEQHPLVWGMLRGTDGCCHWTGSVPTGVHTAFSRNRQWHETGEGELFCFHAMDAFLDAPREEDETRGAMLVSQDQDVLAMALFWARELFEGDCAFVVCQSVKNYAVVDLSVMCQVSKFKRWCLALFACCLGTDYVERTADLPFAYARLNRSLLNACLKINGPTLALEDRLSCETLQRWLSSVATAVVSDPSERERCVIKSSALERVRFQLDYWRSYLPNSQSVIDFNTVAEALEQADAVLELVPVGAPAKKKRTRKPKEPECESPLLPKRSKGLQKKCSEASADERGLKPKRSKCLADL